MKENVQNPLGNLPSHDGQIQNKFWPYNMHTKPVFPSVRNFVVCNDHYIIPNPWMMMDPIRFLPCHEQKKRMLVSNNNNASMPARKYHTLTPWLPARLPSGEGLKYSEMRRPKVLLCL